MENQEAVKYINDLIQNTIPGASIDVHQQNHFNYFFNVKNNDESGNIIFGRDAMDDFDKALQGDRNSDYYRGLEGSVKFKIYIALGKAGLIPRFPIAKEILNEKRDWHNDIRVHFVREDWFYKVLAIGLKDLKMFLGDIIKKYGSQPEIENEIEYIEGLLSYYNEHKSFEESGASDVNLGYLKAAAVAFVIKKEKERQDIRIPRVLNSKNKEIYDIVEELRKDHFLQIKMPDCVYDYAKNIESGYISEEAWELNQRNAHMPKNILCGPLAKKSCDLLSSIENDFSDKNVFLDIPYQPNYGVCETALRSVLTELGFKPIAAKDKLTSNAVLCKVCRIIKTCAFGVTDISSDSNSVSYEYGLMHGLGMKVCLFLQKEYEKFSDIDALEHNPYSGVHELSVKLARWLMDNIPGVDLKKANALVDRETQAITVSGDAKLPKLKSAGAMDNELKKIFLEDIATSKKYNAEMVKKIKTEFSSKKLFFMTATPIPIGFDMVDVNDAAIQKVMASPSFGRSSGWNMSFYDSATGIVHTYDGIEKQLGVLRLRLFRNGYVDFRTIVNDSFSWGMEDKSKEGILFNPYSITEYPVSFFRFLRELNTIVNGLNSFHVAMGFINCGEYSLRPYGLNAYGQIFGMEQNKRNLDDWYFEKDFSSLIHENDSDALIFSERIYNTFGYDRKKIPYFNEKQIFEAKE